MCGSFVLLLLLGVPVAFAIGLSSIATALAADLPMAIVFQKMVGGMQIFSFLAIPVFNLILACLIPALLLTASNLVAAYAVARKRGYPTHGAFPGFAAVFSAFLAALPGLLVIVIILGGILSGVFTATESAATAVCWA